MDFAPIYNVRPIQNLKDMLEQSQKLFGDKNAFLIKNKNSGIYEGISYNRLKSDVDALGTAFISMGLKDKFIAVMGENRYEWCVTYLATANGTGVIVPLDKELPIAEIVNLLQRSNASAIVFSGKYTKEMQEVSSNLSSVKYFIDMDLEEDKDGFLSLSKLIEKGQQLLQDGDRSFIDAPVDNEAMNFLLFTSGTTDLAKGVMLSHKNIISNIMATCSVLYIDSRDSVLSILPLHHTYECTHGFLLMLYNGCTISFIEGLKHIAKNLKEVRPSIILAVPLILESMYKKIWDTAAKEKGKAAKLKVGLFISNLLYNVFKIDIRKKLFKQIHDSLGGNVRLVISGAAAINPEVSKGFRAMGIKLRQGYGLTECSPIVTVNREFNFRDDSIGQPLPGVEVRLEDVNSEGIGELVVKGPNVMLGYYNNPEATEKVMRDGWFYTGDLGHMDESGYFFITGRKKNVIVTKNGKNIFPEEVEAYLNKSPFIMESMIFGKYDESSGETYVHAQIYPDYEAIKEKLKLTEVSAEDVRQLIAGEVKNVNRSMPLYKHIKQFTIRENEFAKTTTKKIKRYVEKTG